MDAASAARAHDRAARPTDPLLDQRASRVAHRGEAQQVAVLIGHQGALGRLEVRRHAEPALVRRRQRRPRLQLPRPADRDKAGADRRRFRRKDEGLLLELHDLRLRQHEPLLRQRRHGLGLRDGDDLGPRLQEEPTPLLEDARRRERLELLDKLRLRLRLQALKELRLLKNRLLRLRDELLREQLLLGKELLLWNQYLLLLPLLLRYQLLLEWLRNLTRLRELLELLRKWLVLGWSKWLLQHLWNEALRITANDLMLRSSGLLRWPWWRSPSR